LISLKPRVTPKNLVSVVILLWKSNTQRTTVGLGPLKKKKFSGAGPGATAERRQARTVFFWAGGGPRGLKRKTRAGPTLEQNSEVGFKGANRPKSFRSSPGVSGFSLQGGRPAPFKTGGGGHFLGRVFFHQSPKNKTSQGHPRDPGGGPPRPILFPCFAAFSMFRGTIICLGNIAIYGRFLVSFFSF